ncbi:MAG: hypothetical protein RL095_1089 [Verrucomicrobiota bacterium]|jgi:hypothetical protein
MKDVIKNYKSVIAVYAVTLVASAGVTWYYFSVKSNIESLIAKKTQIADNNKALSNFEYEVRNDSNVNLQKKNTEQRVEELKKIKAERIASYSEGLDVKADIAPIAAKQTITLSVDRIVKELKKQQLEIDPKDELSFAGTRKDILNKNGAEIQVALQQLNYVEHVLKNAAAAGIEKVLSIKRPKDLVISVEKDKSLPWEFHTFQFKFVGSPEALKKLINQLSNEKGYYSRISFVEFRGKGSMADIIPTYKYPAVTSEAAKEKSPPPGNLLGDAQPVAPEDPKALKQPEAPKAEESPKTSAEPDKHETNPPAFDKPTLEADINVDWIIFKKDQKGK